MKRRNRQQARESIEGREHAQRLVDATDAENWAEARRLASKNDGCVGYYDAWMAKHGIDRKARGRR